ncbi:hypothetical protein LCGC14_0306120 [marine sediment metagenome]|uniref:Uncharacterized protein n=1 Tax=marine sediment metagenome TaxID=412755 RepID=A0A0F9WV64_9ZZZZ
MLKAWIYGRHNVGDKAILATVQKALTIESEHLGERVDLSRIKPEEGNLIIVINNSLFNADLDKICAYIKKDLTKPLVVIRKIKTFGAILFEDNLAVKEVVTNKIYIFSGIFYVPKEDLKRTISETLKNIDKTRLRTFFLDTWRRR